MKLDMDQDYVKIPTRKTSKEMLLMFFKTSMSSCLFNLSIILSYICITLCYLILKNVLIFSKFITFLFKLTIFIVEYKCVRLY